MKRLSPAEQLVVLDAVLDTIAKLRDHAASLGDGGAARRLDEEHTGADDSKQKLLWSLDAEHQQSYAALIKALKSASPKSKLASAKKAKPRPRGAKKSSGKRVR